MVKECLRAVRAVRGFGPTGPGDRAALGEEAARISAKYGAPVSGAQLETLRIQEVSLAARSAGVRAQRVGEELIAGFRSGESVQALADRHGLPPLAALRQILIEMGHDAPRVKAMLADPSSLPPRLAAEAPALFENDLGSRPHMEALRAAAQGFEDHVGSRLKGLGLDFETEADLRGKARPGEPLLTPDFLLKEAATIDGRQVFWLDAKNYPAVDGPLIMPSLIRQVKKYTTRFGPGALVFNGGILCGSETARLGALVLDGA